MLLSYCYLILRQSFSRWRSAFGQTVSRIWNPGVATRAGNPSAPNAKKASDQDWSTRCS